jgi:hypothetical protein
MIDRLDHHVLTVPDAVRGIDVHLRGVGMRAETFGAGRRAARPAPGTADPCVIAARLLAAVEAPPAREGFRIEPGPVLRTGAAGPVRSLHLRDLDGNLVGMSDHA